MNVDTLGAETTEKVPRIECGSCQQFLPLRMTNGGERAAVWLCAECSIPFVALCVEDRLPENANSVRLDERYFDTTGLPNISPELRRQVVSLAHRSADAIGNEKRRSTRVARTLVVPAVRLGPGFVPTGMSFQLMVANLSCEGIGLVHSSAIDAEYIALELGSGNGEPIQVIVRIVRQKELESPFYEIGGEFYVRLGNDSANE